MILEERKEKKREEEGQGFEKRRGRMDEKGEERDNL